MNTVLAGTQRAATSWIFNQIQTSKTLTASPIKEWHYFDQLEQLKSARRDGGLVPVLRETEAGELRDTNLKRVLGSNRRLRDQDYAFAQLAGLSYLGGDKVRPQPANALEHWTQMSKLYNVSDFTPANCLLEADHWRELKQANPNLRVILTMRNPIKRVWSGYQTQLSVRRSLGLGPKNLEEYCNSKNIRDRTDLVPLYLRLRSAFEEDDICIIRFDDVLHKPQRVIRSLESFLSTELHHSERQSKSSLARKKTSTQPTPLEKKIIEAAFSESLSSAEDFFGMRFEM